MSAGGHPKVLQGTMRVPVEMEYELGEQTEVRLREMSARCVGETIDVEYYYDTESFQLASTQTWLNQHKGQWGLILAQDLSEETKSSEVDLMQSEEKKSSTVGLSPEERLKTDTGCIKRPGSDCSDNEKIYSLAESKNLTAKSQVQGTSLDDISAGSIYTELNDPHSIMMHITKCLQLPLTHAEIQNMTMMNFLRKARIQIYDSWTRSRSLKYSLPGGFMVVVERNNKTPTVPPSVLLTMDADVLNISSELERMDQLHKELGLKLKASSDTRSQMTEL
ncbi:uncharacterized protein [Paramisgurnus dabryanus]|uniref:uncharacterized protein n=1 Tax=Paramisgurnus dabryanus TaxID=90735 RepID=UPI003CCF3EB2